LSFHKNDNTQRLLSAHVFATFTSPFFLHFKRLYLYSILLSCPKSAENERAPEVAASQNQTRKRGAKPRHSRKLSLCLVCLCDYIIDIYILYYSILKTFFLSRCQAKSGHASRCPRSRIQLVECEYCSCPHSPQRNDCHDSI
jgi:hypothetical protein